MGLIRMKYLELGREQDSIPNMYLELIVDLNYT